MQSYNDESTYPNIAPGLPPTPSSFELSSSPPPPLLLPPPPPPPFAPFPRSEFSRHALIPPRRLIPESPQINLPYSSQEIQQQYEILQRKRHALLGQRFQLQSMRNGIPPIRRDVGARTGAAIDRILHFMYQQNVDIPSELVVDISELDTQRGLLSSLEDSYDKEERNFNFAEILYTQDEEDFIDHFLPYEELQTAMDGGASLRGKGYGDMSSQVQDSKLPVDQEGRNVPLSLHSTPVGTAGSEVTLDRHMRPSKNHDPSKNRQQIDMWLFDMMDVSALQKAQLKVMSGNGNMNTDTYWDRVAPALSVDNGSGDWSSHDGPYLYPDLEISESSSQRKGTLGSGLKDINSTEDEGSTIFDPQATRSSISTLRGRHPDRGPNTNILIANDDLIDPSGSVNAADMLRTRYLTQETPTSNTEPSSLPSSGSRSPILPSSVHNYDQTECADSVSHSACNDDWIMFPEDKQVSKVKR